MPSSASEICSLLRLQGRTSSRFVGGHPERTLLEKVYGGQLFGQALAAASLTVDGDRPVHSFNAMCLEPGGHDEPVLFDVERVRDGRSFSSRYVRAFQGDRQVLRLSASFQPPEPGFEHSLDELPATSPDSSPPLHEVMREVSTLPSDEWKDEWSGLDIRYASNNRESAAVRKLGKQALWVRIKGRLPDDPVLHRNAIAYLSDLTLLSTSLIPHGLVFGSADVPRATLNHSVWFHSDARADEWLFVDQVSPWAGGARGLSFARIFTQDGKHVASLAQEGLIRPYGATRAELGLETGR